MKQLTPLLLALVFWLPCWSAYQWQTTKGILEFGSVTVDTTRLRSAVQPHYLDVEEELYLRTQGRVYRGGNPDALEIAGNFDLPPGSVIIGMLLWNGDVILKAKLKPKAMAVRQYDSVVNRDVIIPRDPAIIEKISNNSYRLRIFPVSIGNARKIRIRYLIPLSLQNQKDWILPWTGAASRASYYYTGQNFFDFFPSNTHPRYSYFTRYGNATLSLDLNSHHQLDPVLVNYGINLQHKNSDLSLLALTEFHAGNYQGHYAFLNTVVPQPLIDKLREREVNFNLGENKLYVTLQNGPEIRKIQAACSEDFICLPIQFMAKSQRPWANHLHWELEQGGKSTLRFKHQPELIRSDADSSLALLWAGSDKAYGDVQEFNRGERYGFIDTTMSLLALENDSLGRIAQIPFETAGVPKLLPQEITPSNRRVDFVTIIPDVIIATGLKARLFTADKLSTRFQANNTELLLEFSDTRIHGEQVIIRLFDVKGKVVAQWNRRFTEGSLRLNLPALPKGNYLLSIKGKGWKISKKLKLG